MSSSKALREVVTAVHFDAPINLTVLDLAAWSEAFSDFVAHQELPPHPRTELQQLPQFQLQMAPDLPRIVKRGSSRYPGLWILFQNDRFAFGWDRSAPLGGDDDYPGYDSMQGVWSELAGRFYAWHRSRLGGAPKSRLIELSYRNNWLVNVNGSKRRISDIFRLYRAPSPARMVFGFNMTWAEAVAGDPQEARVAVNFGGGAFSSGEPALHFNLNGLAAFSGDPLSAEGRAKFDQIHERIIDMFRASIISDEASE